MGKFEGLDPDLPYKELRFYRADLGEVVFLVDKSSGFNDSSSFESCERFFDLDYIKKEASDISSKGGRGQTLLFTFNHDQDALLYGPKKDRNVTISQVSPSSPEAALAAGASAARAAASAAGVAVQMPKMGSLIKSEAELERERAKLKPQERGLCLRPYMRGGLIGKFLKRGYVRFMPHAQRAREEYDLLHYMRASHLPVPRPLIAREITGSFLVENSILLEQIPNCQNLAALLETDFKDKATSDLAKLNSLWLEASAAAAANPAQGSTAASAVGSATTSAENEASEQASAQASAHSSDKASKEASAQAMRAASAVVALNAPVLVAMGEVLAQFFDKGIYHSDLNLRNILLNNHNECFVVDFDKCLYKDELKEKDVKTILQRLKRSLVKELTLLCTLGHGGKVDADKGALLESESKGKGKAKKDKAPQAAKPLDEDSKQQIETWAENCMQAIYQGLDQSGLLDFKLAKESLSPLASSSSVALESQDDKAASAADSAAADSDKQDKQDSGK